MLQGVVKAIHVGVEVARDHEDKGEDEHNKYSEAPLLPVFGHINFLDGSVEVDYVEADADVGAEDHGDLAGAAEAGAEEDVMNVEKLSLIILSGYLVNDAVLVRVDAAHVYQGIHPRGWNLGHLLAEYHQRLHRYYSKNHHAEGYEGAVRSLYFVAKLLPNGHLGVLEFEEVADVLAEGHADGEEEVEGDPDGEEHRKYQLHNRVLARENLRRHLRSREHEDDSDECGVLQVVEDALGAMGFHYLEAFEEIQIIFLLIYCVFNGMQIIMIFWNDLVLVLLVADADTATDTHTSIIKALIISISARHAIFYAVIVKGVSASHVAASRLIRKLIQLLGKIVKF